MRVVLAPLVGVLCSLTMTARADNPSACACTAATSLHDLRRLNACELERLFVRAAPGPLPCGSARGRVLLLTEHRHPRFRAGVASLAWKGKVFECDGHFINQWVGFRALTAQAVPGTSWLDGRPCWAIEYALETPLFGKTRDEFRAIAPGLYLARLYDRCPCPRFRGWFALQVTACADSHSCFVKTIQQERCRPGS